MSDLRWSSVASVVSWGKVNLNQCRGAHCRFHGNKRSRRDAAADVHSYCYSLCTEKADEATPLNRSDSDGVRNSRQ